MYYREHAPPHFRAIYGSCEVTAGIENGVVRGEFPSRALRHVLDWCAQHKGELMQNWEKARNFEPLLDKAFFAQLALHPDLRTGVWPNGADLAPEFLHDRLTRKHAEVSEP